MGETAEADLNATTYVHQPTLPLRQGDDEMSSRIGPQAWSRWCGRVWHTCRHVSKVSPLPLRSLSELALLDLLFSLARWLPALVDLVPNGPSLSVPDDMSYSAVSVFMPVAVARLTLNSIFCDPSFLLHSTPVRFVSHSRVVLDKRYYCPSFSDQASPDQPNNNSPTARAITQGSLPAAR